jgi:hypothetical protein
VKETAMTIARPVPPLPQPLRPAAAARAVAQAAEAAARAWARPLDPAAHSRAVSQLHSVLRDLGIAARGLALFEAGRPPGRVSPGFAVHAGDGSRLLLEAWQRLDGVLAAEGIAPSGDPDDPGAALCQAARDAILAWRQPSGTAADRDDTVRHLITTSRLIGEAITGLAACAPRQLTIDLQAVSASLDAAAACLTAAVEPGEDTAPGNPGGGQ